MTCDHNYKFAKQTARLTDGTLMLRCMCGEVFITHRQRKEAKPHIYFQHGYWRVTRVPDVRSSETMQLYVKANSFAIILNRARFKP